MPANALAPKVASPSAGMVLAVLSECAKRLKAYSQAIPAT